MKREEANGCAETACASFGYWKDNNTVACYDSYNTELASYTDTSVNNTVNRQWMWYLCNEPYVDDPPLPVSDDIHILPLNTTITIFNKR